MFYTLALWNIAVYISSLHHDDVMMLFLFIPHDDGDDLQFPPRKPIHIEAVHVFIKEYFKISFDLALMHG